MSLSAIRGITEDTNTINLDEAILSLKFMFEYHLVVVGIDIFVFHRIDLVGEYYSGPSDQYVQSIPIVCKE